ncbi:Elongator subunit elp6 [Coemansia sp. RSA 2706]|nr:Elongator subunit elp6 [Coemansia sp. RSA 2706]KAJ2308104.1 Elongator subunit elp6 [Coemansia sp. RSA 2704]KAJ2368379.1 Elongator subunit elp6 [Coemansia sp. RSA 2610]KAJ2391786.1 Elongator subunit elp6 [Coemansia sp. RSA 2611]KAJ2738171.1 Elongator subunit elp6 [Coemansia sp. Cherry 401B]
MATYKTLSASLNWPTGLPAPGSTVLISGGLESEGSVLIPHFVNSTFESQQPVILLSFRQTFNHYMHIMRKMGVNLARHKLQFVNGLVQADFSALPPATRPHFTLDKWPEFFQWLNEQPPSLLIIDGLCSLLDQGFSMSQVLQFFVSCQRIAETKAELDGGYAGLVVNVLLDEFSELLVRSMIRRSHYFFSFEGLSSGASNDVSGQLTVIPGHLHCQIQTQAKDFKPALLHYRVSDVTVQFFSPGQSSTVL